MTDGYGKLKGETQYEEEWQRRTFQLTCL